MKNDNSIKKDLMVTGISIVLFYVALFLATLLDNALGLNAAFNLVDIANVITKTAVASTLVWLLFRVVFNKTLGKDFGDTFDKGWGEMGNVEKTRWIIGSFIFLLYAILSVSNVPSPL